MSAALHKQTYVGGLTQWFISHDQRAMTEAGACSEVTERKCNAAGFSRRSSPIKTYKVRLKVAMAASCVLPSLPLCFGQNHLKHVRFHQMLR